MVQRGEFLFYMPMHEVVPRAVTIAVAILAIIWMMNFKVSFLLITQLLFSYFFIFKIGRGFRPNP